MHDLQHSLTTDSQRLNQSQLTITPEVTCAITQSYYCLHYNLAYVFLCLVHITVSTIDGAGTGGARSHQRSRHNCS